MEQFLSNLLGPNGGQVALGFGAGATVAWIFLSRTYIKHIEERLKEAHALYEATLENLRKDHEREIAELISQVENWKAMYEIAIARERELHDRNT